MAIQRPKFDWVSRIEEIAQRSSTPAAANWEGDFDETLFAFLGRRLCLSGGTLSANHLLASLNKVLAFCRLSRFPIDV
ncbi:MAG: hypothetical protein ABR548_07340 [Actinomycetota bacterium]|nr:hypothetical protein [Actinomycetota bacterium]